MLDTVAGEPDDEPAAVAAVGGLSVSAGVGPAMNRSNISRHPAIAAEGPAAAKRAAISPAAARLTAVAATGCGSSVVPGGNLLMNLGHKLARWVKDGFGSSQCRALTGCNFASADDVRRDRRLRRDGDAGALAERLAPA